MQRLLAHAGGCYDDLVVVHDGPESPPTPWGPAIKQVGRRAPETLSLQAPGVPPREIARDYAWLSSKLPLPPGYRRKTGKARAGSIHAVVNSYKGRFFEGPHCFQQEPHWPFAWWAAKNEWILRLDSDEYPSKEMKEWLMHFRKKPAPAESVSGFTCLWPLWDRQREYFLSLKEWRPFLFSKTRTRFIGMAEQSPIPCTRWLPTGLILHHQPPRKSFGLRNLIFRRRSYSWRMCIAFSLLLPPASLPRWNYQASEWPLYWEKIIRRPWATGLVRFARSLFRGLLAIRLKNTGVFLSDLFATATHQLLMAWTVGYIYLLKKTAQRRFFN